jgi:putative heme-binding domain-containing protein
LSSPRQAIVNQSLTELKILSSFLKQIQYEPWLVKMKSGESYYGFVQGETTQNLLLKDLTGKQYTLSHAEIESKKQESKSIMPDPAGLGMTAQDLADVSAYLLGLK